MWKLVAEYRHVIGVMWSHVCHVPVSARAHLAGGVNGPQTRQLPTPPTQQAGQKTSVRATKIHFAIRINWLSFPSAISIWVLTPLWVWLAPHTAALPLCWVGSQVTQSQIWQDSSRKCYWIIIWEPAAITTFCIDPTTVHLYCSCGPYITTKLGIQLIEETWIQRTVSIPMSSTLACLTSQFSV